MKWIAREHVKVDRFACPWLIGKFIDPEGGEAGFNFEDATTGKPPAGFTTALAGSGTAGEWVIQEDTNRFMRTMILAQTNADRTSGRYPLRILDGVAARDVDLSVDFKPVSGKGDQAAGLVWRLKDKDNFFVVRANADGEHTKDGLGNSEVGIKDRSLYEDGHGVSTSIYPQISFNNPSSFGDLGVKPVHNRTATVRDGDTE